MSILDEIDTFVVVMLENRSFDHVLGYLSQPEYGGRTDVDGLPDPNAFHCENFHDNQVYKPYLAKDGRIDHDLPHERETIHEQLDFQNGKATMGGFVKSYVARTQSVVTQPPPMGYLTPDSVPISDFLAREFMICDRWFSPLPAGTQPNRAMAICGTSLIENNVPMPPIPNKDRLWDWLEAKGVDWRLYHCGLSFNAMFDLPKMLSSNLRNFKLFSKDFADNSKPLPPVILIEPEYADSPVNAVEPNDNHPPIPMAAGEAFLRDIYVALTKNPKRWKRTLLIITYDEHGGYFDHVPPPAIRFPPPAGARFVEPFLTAGVRVPAFLVSPRIPRGSVCKEQLDHTSILQMLAEKFSGGARNYSADVNARLDQGIASVTKALRFETLRSKIPAPPKLKKRMAITLVQPKILSDNQRAMLAAARDGLKADPKVALKKFPQLSNLPVEENPPKPPKV